MSRMANKTFGKKIRSQHPAAIAAANENGGRFFLQNRRPGFFCQPGSPEICAEKAAIRR
jgi:hypothetical protein